MRTIKFRILSWVEGEQKHWAQLDLVNELLDEGCHLSSGLHDINSLSQFTGLTDEKNREIYEGDILIGDGKIQRTVEYWEHEAAFCLVEGNGHAQPLDLPTIKRFHMEIIGNRHENPELCNK